MAVVKIDIDTMLEKVGDFGRYQIFLMFLFSVINVISAFHYFSQTFISVVPDHWCNSSDLRGMDMEPRTIELVKEYLRPLEDSSCMKFEWIDPGVEESWTIVNVTRGDPLPAWNSVKCNDGWIYNRDSGFESIPSELDWVCDDNWKPALGQSTFFIGSVLGTLALGILSDRVGRLPVLCIANGLAFLGNMATVFTNSLTSFATCRLLSGLATDSNFVMMYIIVMEYVRPSMRTFGLNLCIGVFYCLGCVLVPLLAIFLVNWRHFLLATTLPFALVVLYYFVVPESAQWLVSRGRTRDAAKSFQRIAACNKKTISQETLEQFITGFKNDDGTSPKKPSSSLLGLFYTPRLRRKTCILIFKSMVLTLCYDAISRNVSGLGFSPFLLFSASSLIILPSCLIILIFQDKIGRKAMTSGSLLVSGLFTAITGVLLAFFKNTDPYITVGLAAVGRLGVYVAYNSSVQYAAELIPTEVRGQGVAAVHVAGFAAAFFSSYIIYLGTYSLAIPPLLLGGLSIICAFLCLFLPETLNRSLPVTLEDGEHFGEGERTWDFAFQKSKTTSTQELVTDPEFNGSSDDALPNHK